MSQEHKPVSDDELRKMEKSAMIYGKVGKLSALRLIADLRRAREAGKAVAEAADNLGRWCQSAVVEGGTSWHMTAEEYERWERALSALPSGQGAIPENLT